MLRIPGSVMTREVSVPPQVRSIYFIAMPIPKLILQQPYKVAKKKDGAEPDQPEINAGNGRKNGKKTKQLNPNATRLYLFFIIDRDHVIKIKTEYMIYPEQWDFSKQQKKEIRGSAAGTSELNAKIKEFNKNLQQLKDDMEEQYQKIIKQFPDMPFDQISKALKEYGKGKEIPFASSDFTFMGALDKYIEYLEGEVAPGTIKKYDTLKSSLQTFGTKNKKYESLTFSMIDHSFYDAYTKYLKNQEPRGRQKRRPDGKQKGLLIDTVGKYIETLKTFLTWAEERKYNRFTVYKSFRNISKADRKRKKQGHEIVTLTLHELKQFYEHDFSADPSMDRVRDMFCFECFTGQRWSDVQQFDKSQLHDDIWSFTSHKTKELIEIDMTGFAAPALDILKKYNYKFPTISNQKFNEYLKKAAEKAEINAPVTIRRYVGANEITMSDAKHEFMSSHTARRSCVSILLNECNMNPVHVMEITGHSDFKTLQKYIKPDRQARREAMSKTKPVDKLLTVVKDKAV